LIEREMEQYKKRGAVQKKDTKRNQQQHNKRVGKREGKRKVKI